MIDFNWDPFPILTTPRLILRRMEPSDINEYFILRRDKEGMKYIHRPLTHTLQDVKELMDRVEDFFLRQEAISWVITEKGNSKLIGTIGFYRMKKEHYRAEVGYQLQRSYYRKGITSEALLEVVKYGFEIMNLHTIEADVNPDNVASMKLLEKANFIKEGMFKECFYFEGKFYDSVIYSLLSPLKFNEIE